MIKNIKIEKKMDLKNNCYLLIGKNENWDISLKKNIWGFTAKNKKQWEQMKSNDLLAFYITKPTQLIIGFGVVKDKFFDNKLTWPTEKFMEEVMWPYKISFKIIYACDNTQEGISLPVKMNLQSSRRKIEYKLFNSLIENADKKWSTSIFQSINTIIDEN